LDCLSDYMAHLNCIIPTVKYYTTGAYRKDKPWILISGTKWRSVTHYVCCTPGTAPFGNKNGRAPEPSLLTIKTLNDTFTFYIKPSLLISSVSCFRHKGRQAYGLNEVRPPVRPIYFEPPEVSSLNSYKHVNISYLTTYSSIFSH